MKREIVFRGQKKNSEEWVTGHYFVEFDHNLGEEVHFICSIYFEAASMDYPYPIVENLHTEVKPETVGQFTGLKDKNGKNIFEDDIVKTISGYVCIIKWDFVKESDVKYDYEYTGFCLYNIKQNRNYHLDTDELEVIGNIHDNPELLKGEEEL